ncbi:hypothetical protein J9317_18490 [Metabacillus sp. KIGAM252]|uniref:Small, acid-soluble spore protein, alpha/beta type n=1 Tax=Metabacillus flavus TaxID=2823519 RepID=A0ABS5LJ18_9BACI|nr:hypothetical protein [Metabacillus flavus]MBS2970736.1 hypothetical protein [Metabacillus flavus]
MPNKDISKLKNEVDRYAAGQWKDSLGLKTMSTREWNNAADLASRGKSDSEIKNQILKDRKK